MSSKVEISKSLVLVNSASAVVARLLHVTVLVWLFQYLLDRISEDEFAILAVVTAVMVFVPILTSFLTSGISRYVVEAYARDESGRVIEIVSSIFPLLALCGSCFLVLGGSFAWNIDFFLTIAPDHLGDARLMMALLFLGFSAHLMLLPFGVGFHVRQRFVLLNVLGVGRELLQSGLLFVLLLGVSTRVLWVVVASVSANLTFVIVVTLVSRRLVPLLRFEHKRFRWNTAKSIMNFGFWTTLGQVSSMIYFAADTFILNKLGSTLDQTIFRVGALFDNQVHGMAAMASAPVQPALTAMHATGDRQRLGNAYLRGGRYALFATLLVTGPLLIYRTDFIRLYLDDSFIETATVLGLLMALHPFIYPSIMLGKIAVATARIRAVYCAILLSQVAKVAVTLFLVGTLKMGAIGCALGTFVTLSLANLFVFWPMGLKMMNIPFSRFLRETLIPGFAPAVAGVFVWYALKSYEPPQSWFQLIVYTFVGHIAYGTTLFFYSLVPDERRNLRGLIEKLIKALPGSKSGLGAG